jgi:hypothetical protein
MGGSASDKSSIQRPFGLAPAIIAFVCLESLVVAQGLLAYQDQFLTVSQMRGRGVDQGLPFLWHFGMWGDLILSGIAAYLIGRYFRNWRFRWISASLAIGFASAIAMNWIYKLSQIPEAHIQNHHLTAAGVVHFFYMAIAIAVFIQFLFFTEGVSLRALRTVSVLLCIHVFFGTHMVLGLLKLVHPLNWYPAQPLQSSFGWITITAISLGLLWRNVGTAAVFSWAKNIARHVGRLASWVYEFIMFWLEGLAENVWSPAGYLRFLNLICGFVGFGWFLSVIKSRLQSSQLFMSGDWSSLAFSSEGLSLFLVFLFGFIYFLSRQSARRELEIGKMLFPPGRLPDEWKPQSRFFVTIQVFAFLGLYMALAWFTDNILISSLFMSIIACFDLNTRRWINRDMARFFSNDKYAPRLGEPDFDRIVERRKVASWYLYELPHLRKEAVRIAGCAIALTVAIFGYVQGSDHFYCAAYIILVVILVGNEILTFSWRYKRERRLRAIQ